MNGWALLRKAFPILLDWLCFAHRSQFARRSPVLRAMFAAGFREAAGEPVTIVDTTAAAFRAFLRHLYTYELAVSDDLLLDVLGLADRYQLTPLHRHCGFAFLRGTAVANALPRL